MKESLKEVLYFAKFSKLWNEGIAKGLILPIEDEVYQRLDNLFFCSLPISIIIKYLKPNTDLGKCMDRSWLLSAAFENPTLVHADLKYLALKDSSRAPFHYWIENDGWVYCSFSLLKYKKELFYKMYVPTRRRVQSKQELLQNSEYQKILNSSLQSLLDPTCFDRFYLNVSLPLAEGIARNYGNQKFIDALEEYKKKVDYDYGRICQDMNNAIEEKLRTGK